MATWNDVEREEPAFAARVRARFDAGKHKTIATLRADGSPRISGIEVGFDSVVGIRQIRQRESHGDNLLVVCDGADNSPQPIVFLVVFAREPLGLSCVIPFCTC